METLHPLTVTPHASPAALLEGTPILLCVSVDLRKMWLLTRLGTLHMDCVVARLGVCPSSSALADASAWALSCPQTQPFTPHRCRRQTLLSKHRWSCGTGCVLFCFACTLNCLREALVYFVSCCISRAQGSVWHIGDTLNMEMVHIALEVQGSWGLHCFSFKST